METAGLRWRQRLARWLLGLAGWRLVYRPPPGPKAVLILYPHTTNWDFPAGVLARAQMGLRVHWMGKHTLFRGPLGPLFRAMGGIPVDRTRSHGFVDNLREEFTRRREFYLVITPEGTRSRRNHLKSGFYHLALAARVPVGLAFVDYPGRRIGVDTWLELSGDVQADLQRLQAYYADKRGLHPELESDIRFREGG